MCEQRFDSECNSDVFGQIFLFDLNNIIIATPLPVSNPAIVDDSDSMLFKYNSVITTDDAQFGINPIKLVKNGVNILLLLNKLLNNSSPPIYIVMFNIKVIIIK